MPAGAREWRCGCGYALLVQRQGDGTALVFEGANRVGACPRCRRDLADVDARALELGQAIALLDRARAGEALEPAEHDELARALGLEPVVLEQLLLELSAPVAT